MQNCVFQLRLPGPLGSLLLEQLLSVRFLTSPDPVACPSMWSAGVHLLPVSSSLFFSPSCLISLRQSGFKGHQWSCQVQDYASSGSTKRIFKHGETHVLSFLTLVLTHFSVPLPSWRSSLLPRKTPYHPGCLSTHGHRSPPCPGEEPTLVGRTSRSTR